jgi:DNA-binding IclR family transcriptional regulator
VSPQPPAPKNVVADRVLSVLSVFGQADGDLGVSEISRTLSLDKSVVHRILSALVEHGYVDRDPDTRRYQVGLQAWELGQRYSAVTHVTRVAQAPLERLVGELGGTGYLCRLDGMQIVYVAVADSSGALRVHVEVGNRAHAHTTAVGKAMLATLPADELRARLDAAGPLPRRTPSTILEPAKLLEQVEQARRDGHATNRGEHNPGVGSVGVAIRDPAGAPLGVSVAFPMLEQFEGLWAKLPGSLKATVAEIDRLLRPRGSLRA